MLIIIAGSSGARSCFSTRKCSHEDYRGAVRIAYEKKGYFRFDDIYNK